MEWFKLPSNLLSSEKVAEIQMELGDAGFGVLCKIFCHMAQHETGIRPDKIRAIAFQLHSDSTTVDRVLKDFGLFELQDGEYISPLITESISNVEARRERATRGAQAKHKQSISKAQAKQSPADALQSRVEESRVDKKREDNTDESNDSSGGGGGEVSEVEKKSEKKPRKNRQPIPEITFQEWEGGKSLEDFKFELLKTDFFLQMEIKGIIFNQLWSAVQIWGSKRTAKDWVGTCRTFVTNDLKKGGDEFFKKLPEVVDTSGQSSFITKGQNILRGI